MISVLGSFGILVLKLSQRASKAMNIFGRLLDKKNTTCFFRVHSLVIISCLAC